MNLAADLGKSLPLPGFRLLTWQVRRLDVVVQVVHRLPFHSVPLGPCTCLDDTKSPSRCS